MRLLPLALALISAGCLEPTPSPADGDPVQVDPRTVPFDQYGFVDVRHHSRDRAAVEGEYAFFSLQRGADLLEVRQFNRSCEDGMSSCTTSVGGPPGRYRITGFHMGCDANCGTLDGSNTLCSAEVVIETGKTANLLIDADRSSCTISPR